MPLQGREVQDLRREVAGLQSQIRAQQAAVSSMAAERDASRSATAEASDSAQACLPNAWQTDILQSLLQLLESQLCPSPSRLPNRSNSVGIGHVPHPDSWTELGAWLGFNCRAHGK